MATIASCTAATKTGKPSIRTGKIARASSAVTLSLAIAIFGLVPTAVYGATPRKESNQKSATTVPSNSELARLGLEFVTTKPFPGSGETISEYKLKSNGLTILVSERHATPIACVMIVYHVGSRNEAVGYTGSTHFLEHMMFKGTSKHDPQNGTGIDDILKPVGGYNNATTSYDRTNYFEIVPAKDIDICLDIESDRMRHLLLRKEDHDSEMTVVRNELERNEDEPQQLLSQHLFSTAYQEHPYHHPIIGWRSDVENVPIKRLRQFYNDYYWPNNATLMVVGDLKTNSVLKQIVSYFGKIPAAPAKFPEVYTQEPPQQGERRFIVQRGVELPRVAIGFHAVKARSPDTYALDVLESILGDESSKSSRLYKALIDTGLASETDANNGSLHDPGLFVLSATVNAQTKPEQVEKVLLAEADKIKSTPVSASELRRAKQSIIKKLKLTSSDPVGMAEQIAEGIAVADFSWLADYPGKVGAVTGADVQRVAKRYFTQANMTVGYYLPKSPAPESDKLAAGGFTSTAAPAATNSSPNAVAPSGAKETDAATDITAAKPAETAPTATVPNQPPVTPSQQLQPAAGTPMGTAGSGAPQATLDQQSFNARVHKYVLSNGLTVLVMPIKGTGTVAVSGRVRAGEYFRTPDKSLVPDLMSDVLTGGSINYSKEALAQDLEGMGTTLSFGIDDFWLSFNSEVTSEDLNAFMPLVADVLEHPLFADDELDKSKKVRLASIKDAMADTGSLAWNHFLEAWYKPTSVYYDKPFEQQIKELDTITAPDLRHFHELHVTPRNTVLSLVGDITPGQGLALAKKVFQGWQGGPADRIIIDKTGVLARHEAKTIKDELPDKSNFDVYVGHPVSVCVVDPDYFPAMLGNAALGYDSFACRLAPVRDKYGLTYYISSTLSAEFPYSPWIISFSVNPENYDRALALVEKIVHGYSKSGITPKEMEMEKSHLQGAYFVSMGSPKQIASKLCELEILGLGARFIDDFGANLKRVTKPQVDTCIRRYFTLNDAVTSAAGTTHPEATHTK